MPFFPSTAVHVAEALPMLIIVGGAVGGGCVLLICVITLVSLGCRHTGKGELNGQYGPVLYFLLSYFRIEHFYLSSCA